MSQRFASGQKANAICDVCGFEVKLRELRSLTIRGVDTNIKACQECWNPDHPQNELGRYPVDDPQAIRNPRGDSQDNYRSRGMRIPVRGVVATTFVGTVGVSVI